MIAKACEEVGVGVAQIFYLLSDNRGYTVAPPSGNKRTTNQNAPFQISTNQNEPQNLTQI